MISVHAYFHLSFPDINLKQVKISKNSKLDMGPFFIDSSLNIKRVKHFSLRGNLFRAYLDLETCSIFRRIHHPFDCKR